jgi:hypothetical protein
VSNGRKVGSRRWRYRQEKGLDPTGHYPVESLREVILEVLCNLPDDPDHGEQLILRAARDLSGRRDGIYLYPRGADEQPVPILTDDELIRLGESRKGEDGFLYTIKYLSKTSPRCPKCGANPRITSKNLERWLDALLKYSGGKPIKRRVDFRKLPT